MTPPRVAIVGSGPAGCYTAQSLLKLLPAAEITIIDKLPVPYGLVRYGVAPDHVGTKAVTAQFDRLFTRSGVRFVGNVEIDLHERLDVLSHHYDAVVLATGLTRDRDLDIPGWQLPGRLGAGELTRAINAHPDAPEAIPNLGERVTVIGMGNVAIDVARLLSLRSEHLHGSEVTDDVLLPATERVRAITVISRSPMTEAKCDPVMVRELANLPHVRVAVVGQTADFASLSDDARRRAEIFGEVAQMPGGADPNAITITFVFGAAPVAITGDSTVRGVSVRFTDTGDEQEFAADTVVNAIGFAAQDAEIHTAEHEHPNVFTVGWARRGPTGTIPENRADAKAVAEQIVEFLARHRADLAPAPTDVLEHELATSFEQWQRIDRAEREHAQAGRIRTKIRSREELLRVAHGTDHPSEAGTS